MWNLFLKIAMFHKIFKHTEEEQIKLIGGSATSVLKQPLVIIISVL